MTSVLKNALKILGLQQKHQLQLKEEQEEQQEEEEEEHEHFLLN